MEKNYSRVKAACYSINVSMAIVSNLPGVLFLTFQRMYGISYSMLGFLVVINFFTQMLIDLMFSFFSHRFNIEKAVKFTPVLTVTGLVLYAVWPYLFPDAVYAGLIIGTVIFSASGGFVEVLISPVIAAIPAENPEREMSKLHSVYAWGVVGIITFSTLFILVFGEEYWQILAMILAIVPLLAMILFTGTKIPEMETPERVSGVLSLMKNPGLWLCVAAIFLGGASECTMAQWISSYVERAVGMPKVWGDIFGVALFSAMLGFGRTMYSKIGKHIERVLLLGSIGAALCYFISAVIHVPVVGLLACAFTGFCVSMLWPGSLIVAAERIPMGGVFIYAMMAAGGDLGASVGPQFVGLVTDAVMKMPAAQNLAADLGLTAEQIGMKAGMLVAMMFPVAGAVLFTYILVSSAKAKRSAEQK